MDEYSLRLAKPHCPQCHKPKGLRESLDELIPYHNQTAETDIWDRGPEVRAEIRGEEVIPLSERLRATISNAQKAAQEADEEI
jgi:hypothetical protein